MVVRSLYQFPEQVGGYELDPNKGWFSVVVPKKSINLDANPSFELGTTGATAANSVLATSATYQRRGFRSLEVTPSSASDAGFYKEVITVTGQNYAWAVDLYDPAGRIFWLYFADSSGNRVGRVQEIRAIGGSIGKPGWQRVWVNFSEYAGATRRLYIIRKATTGTPQPALTPFYVDGSQIENDSKPSTYFDGDSVGFISGQFAYYWNGPRHNSTATRIEQTGAGGTEVNLIEIGFHILAIAGLGMAPFANIATPLSNGGAFYQQSIPQTRQFMVAGAFTGSQQEIERSLSQLIGLVTPDRTDPHQPMVLRYHRVDDCSGFDTETVDIPCVYEGGLEGSIDNLNQSRVGITFRQFLPTITTDGEYAEELGPSELVADVSEIVYRDTDGLWYGMAGGLEGSVRQIVTGPDGYIYLVGTFTVNDDPTIANLARWNGTTFEKFYSGTVTSPAYSLCFSPDGADLYVGALDFSAVGGTGGIAKYTFATDTWSQLGLGIYLADTNEIVEGMAFGPNGILYITGKFTHNGNLSIVLNHVAQYNPGTDVISAMGTGLSGGVAPAPEGYVIKVDSNNNVYLGGNFLLAGGVANTPYFAKWSSGAWSSVGGVSLNGVVYAIELNADESLVYIGGSFTTIGAVTIYHLAQFDGSAWAKLGPWGDELGVYSTGVVRAMKFGPDGLLYISGPQEVNNHQRLLEAIFAYNPALEWSSDLTILLTEKPTYAAIYAIEFDYVGRLYLGGTFPFPSAAPIEPVYTTIHNIEYSGTDRAWPILEFRGWGEINTVRNRSTGGFIEFTEPVLVADGETVILNTDPLNFSFTSDVNGDLRRYVTIESNVAGMYLKPGNNQIEVYMATSTSYPDAEYFIKWRNSYSSIDGATR